MGLPWRGARAAVAPGSPWGDLSLCPPSSWLTPPQDACSCAPSVSLEGASSLTLTGCPCLDWTLLLPGGPAPTPSTLTPAPLLQVACEYGMVRVVSETGDPRGKDYCILYNPQWAHLPHDLSKAVSAARPAAPPPRRPAQCLQRAGGGQRRDPSWGTGVGSRVLWGCRRLRFPGSTARRCLLVTSKGCVAIEGPALAGTPQQCRATPPPGSRSLACPTRRRGLSGALTAAPAPRVCPLWTQRVWRRREGS